MPGLPAGALRPGASGAGGGSEASRKVTIAEAARSRVLNAVWWVASALLAVFFAAMFALDFWAG